jgi:hypothetical protein
MGKSTLYDQYEEDAEAAEQGIWITDLAFPIKVRSMNSATVRRVQDQMRRKYRQAEVAGGGTLSPEKQAARVTDVLSLGIVVNWGAAAARSEGVSLPADAAEATDREGNVLPCTPANVSLLFTELPLFREDVLGIVLNRQTFNRAALERLKGNSAAPSPSDSATEGTSNS